MPAYNQAFVNPYLKRFFWAQEVLQSGTSIPATSINWNLEACQDIRTVLNHTNYDAAEYVGVPAQPLDVLELTHYTQGTIQCPWRASGFPTYALASILGDNGVTGTVDTASGTTDPWQHIIVPGTKSTRCGSFSLVHDTGALTAARGDNSLLFTAATVNSVQLAFAPNTPLNATVSWVGSFPGSAYGTALTSQSVGIVTAPSAAVAVTPVTRTLGYQGSFSLQSGITTTTTAALTDTIGTTVAVASHTGFPSSGNFTIQIDSEQMQVTAGQGTNSYTVTRAFNGTTGATHLNGANVSLPYTTRVISGDVTLSRQVDPLYVSSVNSLNPLDFLSGPLQLSANLTLIFQSVQAATAYLDWMQSNRMGPTGNPNILKWTDTNSTAHSVELDFYPAKWTALDFQDGTTSRTLTGTITSYQDYSQATTSLTSPVLTMPSQVVLSNNVAAAQTTVASMTNGALSMTVASATGFPASGNYVILVDTEQILVAGGQGTTTWTTLTRGYNGTTAAAHTTANVYLLPRMIN